MNTDSDNQELSDLYQDYWAIHAKMLDEHGPLEIAAILLAQSLSIYKTVLDHNEFNQMVDSISDLRDQVQKLDPHTGYYQ